MTRKIVSFKYNEPLIGRIEVLGPDVDDIDIISEIERRFPEAIDVELIDTKEVED